jgi:Uma2 family endonuclease
MNSAAATTALLEQLGSCDRWVVRQEPELRSEDQVVVPDVAAWPAETATAFGAATPETTPGWVCEVVTPATGLVDRTIKLEVYRRQGVNWVWLLELHLKTLEVLHLRGDTWIVAANHGGAEKVHAAPFDDIELNLGAILTATDV